MEPPAVDNAVIGVNTVVALAVIMEYMGFVRRG
jgi:hypothetical protein